MPVTIKVNGTANSLVHKTSNGISIATIPDVCKTPSPAGPVPIPYPNIAQSITLTNGTTTVKGDKMMAANKGSKFALSNGDQAGTVGGVKSNVFMKEATWILYSFDVKLQGKNACRLTDKMFHNKENTANLAGEFQTPVMAFAFLQQAVNDCDASVSPTNADGSKKTCTKLGNEKHACVEGKIAAQQKAKGVSGGTKVQGECGYPRANPPKPLPSPLPQYASRNTLISNAIASAAGKGRKAISAAIGAALRGRVFPDAAIVFPNGSKTFVDFKFPCPKGHPTRKGAGPSKGGAKTTMSPRQQSAYDALGKACGNGRAWVISPL